MAESNGAGPGSDRDVVLAHSSDLHIGGHSGPADVHILESVVRTATHNAADALILAGDIFDHNRLPLAVLDEAARILGDADLPVLILPGNHDCLAASSVYRRGGIGDPENVRVFGVTDEEKIVIPELELGLWGRPHNDYLDMAPLRNAPARFARHQIVVAHGHWLEHQHDGHRSWLMTDEEIAAVDADYVALGHWDRATIAGDGSVAAYYSGSPDLAKTLNLVRLDGTAGPDVSRVPIMQAGSGVEFRPPLTGGAHETPAQ